MTFQQANLKSIICYIGKTTSNLNHETIAIILISQILFPLSIMTNATFPVVHSALKETLSIAYKSNDVDLLKVKFSEFTGAKDDRKSILDQAFRDILLTDIIEETSRIEALLSLSIAACRADIATPIIPSLLLSDVFDAVTLDQCEALFAFVESNVSVWKEPIFFDANKNNLLRLCNDLLKRFSRAQNTVFCGRILLFLATFFPLSERSGLNIISEFNLENLTEFDTDSTMGDLSNPEVENTQVKIDFNLYSKFWRLQDFFRNPNQCYDLKHWKVFAGHLSDVLSAFGGFKLDQQHCSTSASASVEAVPELAALEEQVTDSQHFFAKFLTNPKLLALQMSDSSFRRSVLVQCLILFQYLQSTVKFKTDIHTLTKSQQDYVRDTEIEVYKLLEETPPNGAKFCRTVQHMLKREELWNNWKNDGCKEFKRPEIPADEEIESPVKKAKMSLGDLCFEYNKQGKSYLGNTELTRLWNLCPDNLAACRGEDRNFLPAIEPYLNANKDADASFGWRALRLLARQSPHFFSLTPTNNKISDYLDMVRQKMQETRTKHKPRVEPENDLVVEKEDVLAEEDTEILKNDQMDDRNVHKTSMATQEQLREISVIIGDDWRKLGAKLGYKKDELDYHAEQHATVAEQCQAMLQVWFGDDEDANMADLGYIMEGLQMVAAADYVKRLLEPSDKMEDISE